jgi:hypothetical protein
MTSLQVCPAEGGGPSEVRITVNVSADCWVGESWEFGTTLARGMFSRSPGDTGWIISAYLFVERGTGFPKADSAKTQLYDAEGVLLPRCVAVDGTPDQHWHEVLVGDIDCPGAAFARVTAYYGADSTP